MASVQALLDELDAELGLPSEEDRRWAERVMAGDPSVLHRQPEPDRHAAARGSSGDAPKRPRKRKASRRT